jgi:trehalose 6-phosphate synthase
MLGRRIGQDGGEMSDPTDGQLTDRPVVILSHRGPVSFRRDGDGFQPRRGAGGLVTALMGLAEHLDDAVWVCAAATPADAEVLAEHEGAAVEVSFTPSPQIIEEGDEAEGPTLHVRYVDVDRVAHEQFYGQVANPLLWFIQHGLYGLATEPDITPDTHAAFVDGYVEVNRRFADAVVEEVEARGGKAIVLLQDYHFYLVGDLVRRRCPDAVISHFIHIPWPAADAWRVLPPAIRDPLFEGLLGCDVVAFHTERFAGNFLSSVADIMDLRVHRSDRSVEVGGRRVLARAYPISVDITAIEALGRTDQVAEHRKRITERHLTPVDDRPGERKLIVRVDRTDPSKNIVRGFRAFGRLLEEHPEWAGRVTFLASLMPSRQDVPEYAEYLAQVGAVVAEINARHHLERWQPIDLRLQEDLPFAVAAYQLADVLVVNAVNDGMNLVAKEAVLLNQRDGVLLLSENTGAHEELGSFALTVHPFDVGQQADAMHQALTMPAGRRRELLQSAADVVRGNDVGRWLRRQLADLDDVVARRG